MSRINLCLCPSCRISNRTGRRYLFKEINHELFCYLDRKEEDDTNTVLPEITLLRDGYQRNDIDFTIPKFSRRKVLVSNRFDLIGGLIALIVVIVIMYWPRAASPL
jgi:hypothetical protein